MVFVWMMTAVSPRVSDLVSSVGRVSIIMLHRMYAWQGFCAYILDLRVNIFISFFWRITDNQGNASSIHFLHIFFATHTFVLSFRNVLYLAVQIVVL